MRTPYFICLCLLLVGCADRKIAEQYAERLGTMLATYRQQIDRKIATEQQSYEDLARVYDASAMNNRQQALDSLRNQQATALTDELAGRAGSPMTISSVHSRLQAYAQEDFDEAAQRFAREGDAYKRSLTALEDLTVEQAQLDGLSATLATLAKPRTRADELRLLGQFACEVNRNYRLLDAVADLKALGAQQKAHTDRKAARSAELAAVADPARKLALQAEIQQLDTQFAAVAKKLAAATAEQKSLGTPCP
jgi:hypothetical protein